VLLINLETFKFDPIEEITENNYLYENILKVLHENGFKQIDSIHFIV
jgi:hypothetical protein